MKQLNFEWIPWMKEYRCYEPDYPQQTVCYFGADEVKSGKADKEAKEYGYDKTVICDSDTMHVELFEDF